MTPTYDILAIGIAAVDDRLFVSAYPPANSKAPILRSARLPGGLAATAAAAACRLGGSAIYLARFGDDELSSYMKSTLADYNIDASRILPDPEGQPVHSTIIVDDTGSRTIFYDIAKVRPVTAADLPDALIRSARLCFLDYIQDPPPIDLAQKIRSVGGGQIPILADIEGRSPSVLPRSPSSIILIACEEFARWATNTADLKTACTHLAQNKRDSTVITAGAHGCYLAVVPDSPPVHIPAFKVDAVDTTGCGDTFHGAFALAIARNYTPHQAATFAAAAAALKATRPGGWTALPTAPELLTFLRAPPPVHTTKHAPPRQRRRPPTLTIRNFLTQCRLNKS